MSITKLSLTNPHLITIFSVFILLGGLYGYFFTDIDLFPDTTPPQVVVLTQQPGGSAKDISNNITKILEQELKLVSGIKNITSTTKDEISSIHIEFFYYKDLSEASAEVTNTINRIKGRLPAPASEPQIFEIDDTNKPVMTLSLTPKPDSIKNLLDIRLLAENDIKIDLLKIDGVANIDLFGGYSPEIKIVIDKNKSIAYNLSLSEIIQKIRTENINIPAGYITSGSFEYIIKTDNSFDSIEKIKNTIISNYPAVIKLKDIADIKFDYSENRSMYHGNGNRAIAINIIRDETYGTVDVIKNVKNAIRNLENKYRDISFQITTDQQPIIDVNIKGMNASLLSAIVMTIIIIFLFLGDYKASLVIGISIPLSFLATFFMLKFSPWTLNMVTLSGLIIAVGMVVDSSIVVLENTFRLYKDEKMSVNDAVLNGANQIAFAILGGMLTTVLVMLPIMFVGGYPEKILRPISVTITTTLIASWIISITVLPLLLKKQLQKKVRSNFIIDFINKINSVVLNNLENFYTGFFKIVVRHRIKFLIFLFIITLVVIRLTIINVGRSLMPDMDTGILNITFEVPPSYSIKTVESVIKKMEKEIYKNEFVTAISTIIGSEAGQMSFGQGGQTTQQGLMQVSLVPRNKRKQTIYEIVEYWRKKFSRYPEIINLSIMEYGATPVETTKAPIHIVITGENDKLLEYYADKLINKFYGIRGLTDVYKSWSIIKPEYNFQVNSLKSNYYGISSAQIGEYIKTSVGGVYAGFFRLNNFIDIPVKTYYNQDRIFNSPEDVLDLQMPSKYGLIYLKSLVDIEKSLTKTLFTRENLENKIDIFGTNSILRISQVNDRVVEITNELKKELPDGYDLIMSGTMSDMNETVQRIVSALVIGLILLYLLLVIMFKNWFDPITIIAIIPFSFLGAFAGLLIFDKPLCMPAMMGIILLNGTIVNNAIIVLTFLKDCIKKGMNHYNAVIETIRLRMRPILMTTTSTVIGLIPLIFEWAVGLERMSPLGIVAAGGLIFGTFLTMIITPLVYTILKDWTDAK